MFCSIALIRCDTPPLFLCCWRQYLKLGSGEDTGEVSGEVSGGEQAGVNRGGRGLKKGMSEFEAVNRKKRSREVFVEAVE